VNYACREPRSRAEAASIKLTRNKITSALILVRAVQLASIVASGERKSGVCLAGGIAECISQGMLTR